MPSDVTGPVARDISGPAEQAGGGKRPEPVRLEPGREQGGVRMAKQRRTGLLVTLGLGAALACAAKDVPKQMGARAKGARLQRMEGSPQYADGKVHNSAPASQVTVASVPRLLAAAATGRDRRHPHADVPLVRPET